MERIVIGKSADVEAEYGQAADAPYTLAILTNEAVISIEGYSTYAAAKCGAEGQPFEYVGD